MNSIDMNNIHLPVNMVQIQIVTRVLSILVNAGIAIRGKILYEYIVPCYVRNLNPLHASSAFELIKQGFKLNFNAISATKPFNLSTRCHNRDWEDVEDFKENSGYMRSMFDVIFCECCNYTLMTDTLIDGFTTLGADIDKNVLGDQSDPAIFSRTPELIFNMSFNTGFQNNLHLRIRKSHYDVKPIFDIDNLAYSYADGFKLIVEPQNFETFWHLRERNQIIDNIINNIKHKRVDFSGTEITDTVMKKINALSDYTIVNSNFTITDVDEPDMMDDICSICTEYIDDGSYLTTVCKHHFHTVCILTWWKNTLNCPNCKNIINL